MNEKKQLTINSNKTIQLLEQMKGEISRCLPKHLTTERMTRIAVTELRKNKKLLECDPISFIAAIMQASQLGLEPGVLGSCYLIPFYNKKLNKYECNFMPGYRGFLDLARRSGQITSLVARSVYENDEFSYEFGLEEKLIHKPCLIGEKGELIAVYAVALLKDGGHQFEVMSRKEIDAIRSQSQSKDNGPWVTHYEEMAKKTAVRKLFKWLPCSVEIQKVVSLDEQQESGIQNIKASASEEFDIDFIDGEYYQEEQPTKSERLMNKINTAKAGSNVHEETGECASPEQLTEIHALMSVKDLGQNKLPDFLKKYNVASLSELTHNQGDEFIATLSKLVDK